MGAEGVKQNDLEGSPAPVGTFRSLGKTDGDAILGVDGDHREG